MTRFVLSRLMWLVPNVLILTFLLFAVLTSWLGSPAAMMLGLDASPDALREMNRLYGFDDPLIEQYAKWLWSALQGDFGRSFATKQTVSSMIGSALPVSVELAVWAISLSGLAAVGLNSLVTRGRIASGLISAVSVVSITIPNFMLGATLIYVFAIYLRWLPTSAWAPWSDGVTDHFVHLILPVMTLSAFYFGSFSMIYRAEYRSVMNQPFVRVAKAKGISDTRVSLQHILPNSVLPVITFMGITLGQLMGGAVVTEVVFSLPGIGRTFVSAIRGNDYPVILAVGIIVLSGMMITNLIADIVIAWINPQVRLSS
jgi:peptide/nickel transport system permease protein